MSETISRVNEDGPPLQIIVEGVSARTRGHMPSLIGSMLVSAHARAQDLSLDDPRESAGRMANWALATGLQEVVGFSSVTNARAQSK